jgi:hypothetical protein
MNKGYDGPTLMSESASATKYRWQVTMRAADATGERKLGYRGSGICAGCGRDASAT